MLRLQVPLPDDYTLATDDEIVARIAAAKEALGDRLLILGHHYQRDEVIRWADAIGDSFKLARFAADNDHATDIVFCGVHFMAESADVLTGDQQRVILPDLNAGCSMADMANIDQVEEAWDEIAGITAIDRVVPITYMNSSAALKAFVGRNGGAVCTSSNARGAVLEWALRDPKAATRCCSSRTSTSAATPATRWASTTPTCASGTRATSSAGSRSATSRARRSCSGRATAPCTSGSGPRTWRRPAPSIPASRSSCTPSARTTSSRWPTGSDPPSASRTGSRTPRRARCWRSAPRSTWCSGSRAQHPDKTIVSLDPLVCPCSTMFRIDGPHLAWVLENLVAGTVVNQIVVDADTSEWAKVALERMLAIT